MTDNPAPPDKDPKMIPVITMEEGLLTPHEHSMLAEIIREVTGFMPDVTPQGNVDFDININAGVDIHYTKDGKYPKSFVLSVRCKIANVKPHVER